MKTGAIIQTRMGSTRLPGKVMLDLYGKPVIQHVIERMKQSRRIDEIIIATTVLEQDNIIVEQAEKCGVKWFRGSEDDVLSRYYHAAKKFDIDIVIRLTSDCPLIDPYVTDIMVEFYKKNNYALVTNAGVDLSKRTYPRGLDSEVFSMEILELVNRNATEKYQREHVTPYIYENLNNVFHYRNSVDLSRYRWTLDTVEDFDMIKSIYSFLYHGKHDFFLYDISSFIEKHPEIAKINENVEQKGLK